MPFPEPKPGLVIRYSFLWSLEQQAGTFEGSKDRPCAIILALRDAGTTGIRISVLPITHSAPQTGTGTHIALSREDSRQIGLDAQDHWIVLNEINRFTWPGYDLRAIPGTGRYDYGRLPKATFLRVVKAVIDLDAARKRDGLRGLAGTDRDT